MGYSGGTAQRYTLSILFSILILSSIPLGPGNEAGAEPSRLSELVKFDLQNTKVRSDGVMGWPEFVVGRVNRTTTITTRLENRGDIPLVDVEVTCTIYWYDGFYPDRGQVMFKDIILVDVPPGDHEYSEMVYFNWVPSFSGSYMINISAHVPGDARPMSTDPPFFQGLKYEPIPGSYFYSGVWVASEYWDGSSFDGWRSMDEGSSPDEGWRSVKHPLSQDGEPYHSPPDCFWAGNISTWNTSKEGNHSLISPLMDLTRFDPEPYDIERSKRRPQIFLLYRYRGDLTKKGPSGNGSLAHYISTDNGTTWEPLLDTKDQPVVISGNTSSGKWDYSKRPFYVGTGYMVGLDLGEYQGKKIRIKFDMEVSGLNESGYVLDDFSLMGMDLIEAIPFDLGIPKPQGKNVDPGTNLEMTFNITPRRTSGQFTVRFQTINASGKISPDRDITIEPGHIALSGEETVSITINVVVRIPANEGSGPAWFFVRAMGGGIARDLKFEFNVKPRHNIIADISGPISGKLGTEQSVKMDLSIENAGNIQERVDYTFVTRSELEWTPIRGKVQVGPGEKVTINGEIRISNGTLSGNKVGFIVTSISLLPSDHEVLELIEKGQIDPLWSIHELNYSFEQFFSVELIAMTSYRDVKDPPINGTMELNYTLFLINNGNGLDTVTFDLVTTPFIDGIDVALPSEISIGPDDSEILNAKVSLEFPLPRGQYNITIKAVSSGKDPIKDDIVELILLIGSTPISKGTFLIDGSLDILKEEVIMGMETIIEFSSLTFGAPQSEEFEIGLLLDDVEVKIENFAHTIGVGFKHQLTWTFDTPGIHNLTILIHGPNYPDVEEQGLLNRISTLVDVRYVDISVEGILAGETTLGPDQDPMDPGTYQFKALIANNGNGSANLFIVTLDVFELDEPKNRTTLTVNVTDLSSGTNTSVQFRAVRIRPEMVYRITVTIDVKEKWLEGSVENNEISLLLEVGEDPPKDPIWYGSWVPLGGAGMALVLSLALFLYLMRKKL